MALGRLHRRVAAALALLALAAVWDGWHLLRAERWNAAIAAAQVPEADAASPPQARFARAWALSHGDDPRKALPLYKELESVPALSAAARYNAANVYLRLALQANAAEGPGQALPYAEHAKRAYRETLRHDPSLWNARYNLERALRLFPEEEDADAGGGPPPLPSERAVTTMQGFTLGLP